MKKKVRNKVKRRRKMNQDVRLQQMVFEASQDVFPEDCECGCSIFLPGTQIKVITKERASILGLPPGRGIILPLTCYYCANCKKPFQEPKEVIIQ